MGTRNGEINDCLQMMQGERLKAGHVVKLEQLGSFCAVVPKIGGALANVPTYMAWTIMTRLTTGVWPSGARRAGADR